MNDQDWRERAECRDLPRATFFPTSDDNPAQYAEALGVCLGCPVRRECLEDELRYGLFNQYGMRGGLMPPARRTMLRHRARQRSSP